MAGDDGFTIVQEYQPGRGQLSVALRKGGIECTLVVVIAICGGRVFPADIDDGVAVCEKGRVARADERRGLVGREKSEEVDG